MADYVNGKEMHEELVEYNKRYKQSLVDGTEKPPISKKLAEAFVQIANRMMDRPNFSGYSYKDDMISDGILQCFSKVHTYDPEKANQEFGSAFAWASQLIWNQGIARIKKEQHQSSIKARLIREKMSSEFVQHGVDSATDDSDNSFVEFLKDVDAYFDYNEQAVQNAKQQRSSTLTHRNKTPYKKKEEVAKEVVVEATLKEFL